MTEVVRVAANNNFNCTKEEWAQLKSLEKQHPDKAFFINSSIKTPQLLTISKHKYKAVVTANPDLTINTITTIMKKLRPIKENLAFVRIKYLPLNYDITTLMNTLIKENFPVVLTMQRFNSKKTLTKYSKLHYYKCSCSRYRLTGPALTAITNHVTNCRELSQKPVWICDQSGQGCQICKLCSILTTSQDLKISSVNLSSSGVCPYECPDCYAKTLQNLLTKTGKKPIAYDIIKQNNKQAGKTKHIALKRNELTHALKGVL